MSTDEQPSGQEQSARVNVHIAMTMLEQALPHLGADSQEGQLILTALKAISKIADSNPQAHELVPAELMQLMQQMPGGGMGGGGMPPVGTPPAGGGAPGGGMPGM